METQALAQELAGPLRALPAFPGQLLPLTWGREVTHEVLSPPRGGASGSATAQPWEGGSEAILRGQGLWCLTPATGTGESAPSSWLRDPWPQGPGPAYPLPPTPPAAAASAPPGAGGGGGRGGRARPVASRAERRNQMLSLPPSVRRTRTTARRRGRGWFRPWQSDSSSFSDSWSPPGAKGSQR